MITKRYLQLSLVTLAAVVIVSACTTSTTTTTTTTSSSPGASPEVASSASPSAGGHQGHGGGKKININTAILSELDKLEAQLGVPALSNRIQAERPYKSTEELVSKKVVNQEQFDKIKETVTIEDIVLTGVAKDADYAVKLGLMKGHLYVAKELLELKKPAEAEPHIGHPVEEIYADVEEQLKERKVKDFKSGLISLQDLVKAGAKDNGKVTTNFKESMTAIDGAIAALPDSQRKSPDFVLQVINGLLETANAEYTAAIADGKIKEIIEYQDSRGFIVYADSIYQEIATKMAKDHPDTHKVVTENMKQLKTVWPTVNAPAKPVKTPQQVTELVKAIEQSSQKIVASAK
jgi:DNA uptake protein ComE-like DNA-binding protein